MNVRQADDIMVHRNVAIRMRDGVTLAADVWRPRHGGPRPVLLQRTPYGKDAPLGAMHFSGVDPIRAIDAGYAVVIQDVRGRFSSEGGFTPFANEREDGAATVAWAAAQPWCDGQVVTFGTSYFGATALLAASAAPGALRGSAALLTGADFYEGWAYYGGAFQLGLCLLWAADNLARPELERRRAAGTDVTRCERLLDDMLADPWQAYRTLPLTDVPAIAELAPYYLDWLRHPFLDSYWRELSAAARAGQVSVPVLHIAGWHDVFLKAGLATYRQLKDEAGTAAARAGQRLIVGPWAHAVPYEAVGEVYHGPLASQADSGMTRQILEFADSVTKDREPEMAPVSLFVMGENRWHSYDDWPLPGTRTQTLYLFSGGNANTLHGDGQLLPGPPPSGTRHDRFIYDPLDPVPTNGGSTFLPGLHANLGAGPRDQRGVEERHDVLVYTGPILKDDLMVAGPVSVTLWAATSGRDADWTAKLVDVHPNGAALNVTDGIVRASLASSREEPVPITPDTPWRFDIDLAGTAMLFRRGHRIRLEVSSSNFPRFDRNTGSGTGGSNVAEQALRPTVQKVFHDNAMPSCLLLPVTKRLSRNAAQGNRDPYEAALAGPCR